MKRLVIVVAIAVLLVAAAAAQTVMNGAQVQEKASPAVALVISAGPEGGQKYASALVVRPDGVLLTAYHAVRSAREVQVRLKNGEVYDDVELLGVDERRDVAALRIGATGLTAVQPAKLGEAKPGDRVYVISHPLTLAWTAGEGVLSAVRPADEVPGAGNGFRIVQFSAPISPGSSGGVLLDVKGEALGIIVGSLRGGQQLNFAVPLESVLGLANGTKGMKFASGKSLQLPAEAAREATAKDEPARAPAMNPNPVEAESSDILTTRDPKVMLQKFRTIYVTSRTVWLKEDVMQSAFSSRPEFRAWNIVLVSDPKVADLRLTVNRVLFTWDWTYELTHRNTGMILHTGKITSIEGRTAAPEIAQKIIDLIKPVRPLPGTGEKAK